MLEIDTAAGYFLCGLGSLLGALLLSLAETETPLLRRAVRYAIASLLTLAASLLPFVVVGREPSLAVQVWMAVGAQAGVALMSWSIAALCRVWPPRPVLPLTIATLTGGTLVSATHGTWALAVMFSTGFASLMVGMCYVVRGQFRARIDRPAKMVAGCVAVVALTCFAQIFWTLSHTAPPAPLLSYGPMWFRSSIAAVYVMVPMLLATLILCIVNNDLRRKLHRRASVDELTGTLTRRALAEEAEAHARRVAASGMAVATLVLDLDHFKSINDRHGHATGDEVLRRVAALLHARLRAEDRLSRHGGEEFVLLAPVADGAGAMQLAERVRTVIGGADWRPLLGNGAGVTTSIGVTLRRDGEPLLEAIARADGALYAAKRDGRDRVRLA